MRDRTIETPGPERKSAYVAAHVISHLSGIGKVIDVGCGDAVVKAHLPPGVRYLGLEVNAGNYAASGDPDVVAVGGPDEAQALIRSADADTALLLDVLEHTIDFSGLFEACCGNRHIRRIVVSLPNESNLFERIRFLFGGSMLSQRLLSNYGKPLGYRHLWVIYPGDAEAVLTPIADSFGLALSDRYSWFIRPRNPAKRTAMALIRLLFPRDITAIHRVWVFVRRGEADGAAG